MANDDFFGDDDLFDDLDFDDLDDMGDLDWDAAAEADSSQMEVYDMFGDVRAWLDETEFSDEERELAEWAIAVIKQEVQREYQDGQCDQVRIKKALSDVYDWYPEAAGFYLDGLLSPLATIGPQVRAAAEEWRDSFE